MGKCSVFLAIFLMTVIGGISIAQAETKPAKAKQVQVNVHQPPVVAANQKEDDEWESSLISATPEAMQSYLSKYPNGRYAAKAQQIIADVRSQEQRPEMPIRVSDNVWQTISSSDQYRNTPKMRAFVLDARNTLKVDEAGEVINENKIEGAPIGNRCGVIRNQGSSHYDSGMDIKMDTSTFICGGMVVGLLINGKQVLEIKNLSITGSLFPLREGAESIVRTEYENLTVATNSCRVTGKADAKSLDSKLTGIAWSLHCISSQTMANVPFPVSAESDTYFIEDAGMNLGLTIGRQNSETNKMFIPKAGDTTANISSYGPNKGKRTGTTIYNRHDWHFSE